MKFAIVVVSPVGYQHSHAFDEVAESLRFGLSDLGYDAVITDEPVTGRRSIILGWNLLEFVAWTPPADAIIYNLEQMDPASVWMTATFAKDPLSSFRGHLVWDYSAQNAIRYPMFRLQEPVIVPIGFAPTLERITPAAEDIDVLFVGSMNARRHAIIAALSEAGIRAHTLFGCYGAARDEVIARAKIVLNAHFYDAAVFEIVRVSYILANRKCVVSEGTGEAIDERPFADGVAFTPYEKIVERCAALLKNPDERARIAAEGYRAMVRRPVSAFLKAALP